MDFISQNFPELTHFYTDLESQCDDRAKCTLHDRTASSGLHSCFDESRSHGGFDLGFVGTPCQPFSRQRAKRSQCGSVKNHKAYSTTFEHLLAWLKTREPKVAVVEQVTGLQVAESTTERTTPLDRRIISFAGLHFAVRDFPHQADVDSLKHLIKQSDNSQNESHFSQSSILRRRNFSC